MSWTLQKPVVYRTKDLCFTSRQQWKALSALKKERNQREGFSPPYYGMKVIYSIWGLHLANVKAGSWCLPNNNYSKNNKANAIFILFFKAQCLVALYLEAAPKVSECRDWHRSLSDRWPVLLCPTGLCKLSANPPQSSICDALRSNVCFPGTMCKYL